MWIVNLKNTLLNLPITRYSRVSDAQVLSRLLEICDTENVVKSDDGLEAVIFTAQGDMRQAINNLQATHQVSAEYVFLRGVGQTG